MTSDIVVHILRRYKRDTTKDDNFETITTIVSLSLSHYVCVFRKQRQGKEEEERKRQETEKSLILVETDTSREREGTEKKEVRIE